VKIGPRHVIIGLVEAFNIVGVVLEKPMKILFVTSQLIKKKVISYVTNKGFNLKTLAITIAPWPFEHMFVK
jgi:hypothetical protein